MPSPIAHTAAAYLLYKLSPIERYGIGSKRLAALPLAFLIFAGLSLLPDVDSIPGFIARDLGRFHNNFMHSLIAGVAIAALVAISMRVMSRGNYVFWSIAVLICYELHIVMDYFTIGRGLMLFWPLTSVRFASPLPAFYGVRWSEGWISSSHTWTVISELAFSVLLVFALRGFQRWGTRGWLKVRRDPAS